eukprot:scaffold138728_cov18-Tisochrysis_lutea.AAC.1
MQDEVQMDLCQYFDAILVVKGRCGFADGPMPTWAYVVFRKCGLADSLMPTWPCAIIIIRT